MCIYIYIYIHTCICVCMYVCARYSPCMDRIFSYPSVSLHAVCSREPRRQRRGARDGMFMGRGLEDCREACARGIGSPARLIDKEIAQGTIRILASRVSGLRRVRLSEIEGRVWCYHVDPCVGSSVNGVLPLTLVTKVLVRRCSCMELRSGPDGTLLGRQVVG